MSDHGFITNGDMTPERIAWERWAETLKPGDRCCVRFNIPPELPATVVLVHEDGIVAHVDGAAAPDPWAWENVGPPDDYTSRKCGRSPHPGTYDGFACGRCGARPGEGCALVASGGTNDVGC